MKFFFEGHYLQSSPVTYADARAQPVPTSPLSLAILRELRPRQWLKNGLVFFGLLFSLKLGQFPAVFQASVAFVAFCCISSAGYLFNDLRDIEADRMHATKQFRPIASGQVPAPLAYVLGTVLLLLGFALAATLGGLFVAICVAYVVLTMGYSIWWKHVVLIDVFCISAGFVARAAGGAVAIDVPISPWLYMCTVLGSLVISFGKRRSEIVDLDDVAQAHRPALGQYTLDFLDSLITITATASVMAYSLYAFLGEQVPGQKNYSMMLTTPVVLYGVFRYLYLVRVRNLGGNPEELLLQDRSLAASVVVFLCLTAAILYLGPRIA